jgi:cytochrome c oxidase cbb3-type subunit III
MIRALLLALLALVACKRETRDLRTDPPVQAALDGVRLMPIGIAGTPPRVIAVQGEPFEGNAYQLNQGKRLYDWFNCKGCHANGGGLTGPALTDGWWRYGSDAASIYVSLRDGRPNGMPAFGNRMTTDQLWQLAGYIRSVGAYRGKTAYPSRNDEMQSRPAENRAPATADIAVPPSR